MGEWKEYELEKLTTKIGSGATPRGGSNAYKNDGVSFIRSQNVLDLKFSLNGLAFINDEQANDLKNVTVNSNDILLNITGDSVARVCKVPNNILPARVNQHVAIIRVKEEKITSNFLLYNLIFQKETLLSQSEIGATRRAITKGMIEKFKVNIPCLCEQKAIAEVLSSLDDKIDLLHRQNKTLESLAETLFRQWFVEEASENWEDVELGYFIELYYGKGLEKSIRSGVGYPVIGSSGIVGYHSEFLVEGPGIVIGRKGTLGKTIYVAENFYPIDTAYFVKPKNDIGYTFLYYLLNSIDFKEMNSDSAVPGLNRDIALGLELKLPPAELIREFEHVAVPIFEKINANKLQIFSLEKLRDTLLPRFMSREVSLQNIG